MFPISGQVTFITSPATFNFCSEIGTLTDTKLETQLVKNAWSVRDRHMGSLDALVATQVTQNMIPLKRQIVALNTRVQQLESQLAAQQPTEIADQLALLSTRVQQLESQLAAVAAQQPTEVTDRLAAITTRLAEAGTLLVATSTRPASLAHYQLADTKLFGYPDTVTEQCAAILFARLRVPAEQRWEAYTIPELKAHCDNWGVSKKGNKRDIISALIIAKKDPVSIQLGEIFTENTLRELNAKRGLSLSRDKIVLCEQLVEYERQI